MSSFFIDTNQQQNTLITQKNNINLNITNIKSTFDDLNTRVKNNNTKVNNIRKKQIENNGLLSVITNKDGEYNINVLLNIYDDVSSAFYNSGFIQFDSLREKYSNLQNNIIDVINEVSDISNIQSLIPTILLSISNDVFDISTNNGFLYSVSTNEDISLTDISTSYITISGNIDTMIDYYNDVSTAFHTIGDLPENQNVVDVLDFIDLSQNFRTLTNYIDDLSSHIYTLDDNIVTEQLFNDLSTNHYTLQTNVNDLSANIDDLSTSFYNLTQTNVNFIDLSNNVNDLSNNVNDLSNTYYQTNVNFIDLSTNHYSLKSDFDDLSSNINSTILQNFSLPGDISINTETIQLLYSKNDYEDICLSTINISGDIEPNVADSLSIGSQTSRLNSLHVVTLDVCQNTIYLDGLVRISSDESGNMVSISVKDVLNTIFKNGEYTDYDINNIASTLGYSRTIETIKIQEIDAVLEALYSGEIDYNNIDNTTREKLKFNTNGTNELDGDKIGKFKNSTEIIKNKEDADVDMADNNKINDELVRITFNMLDYIDTLTTALQDTSFSSLSIDNDTLTTNKDKVKNIYKSKKGIDLTTLINTTGDTTGTTGDTGDTGDTTGGTTSDPATNGDVQNNDNINGTDGSSAPIVNSNTDDPGM